MFKSLSLPTFGCLSAVPLSSKGWVCFTIKPLFWWVYILFASPHMKHTREDLQECFLPFFHYKSCMGLGHSWLWWLIKDLHRALRCDCLSVLLSVFLFWLASGSPERSWSLKWLECFLSVFSVEGSAEKCGFSRPLWLYNMYQPFPAAAATAAEAGALKTDFMCGLCHPCRQMVGAFRKREAYSTHYK